MKTLRSLYLRLKSFQGGIFANEEAPKVFDFRKMVMGLLGAKDDASDADLEEMANACMKDETDYGVKLKAADEAGVKLAANEAELATVKATVATLTTERDAANEKVKAGEAEATAAKSNLDTALARATTAETNFANETAKLTTLTTEKEATAAKLTASEQLVANERASFKGITLTIALESGRISAADKPTWEAEFANSADYTATAAKLVKLPAKWKTVTAVNGLGARSSESLSRQEQVDKRLAEIEMANEKAGIPNDYVTNFAQVKKDLAPLFAQMTKPETSKK